MKLTIKTESYLLAGSGESALLVDADTVFHRSGFPYLPSRRIKGILKNSALDVLEMVKGSAVDETHHLIISLFGKKGDETDNGKLKIPNLYIEDWKIILTELETLKASGNDTNKFALSPAFIQHYYTQEIAQTAIDEEKAKDSSLRNYRVVKPNKIFETDILMNGEINDAETALLYLAVLNIRYIGTRRNRGFGKVKCTIEPNNIPVETHFQNLVSWQEQNVVTETQAFVPLNLPSQVSVGITHEMSLTIKLKAPVLVTKENSNQNTVTTDAYISGSRLRGVIAYLLIKKNKLGKNAHANPLFYQAILSGNVQFHHAWPAKDGYVARPIPRNLQKEKGKENELEAKDIFSSPVMNGKSAGSLGFSVGNGYMKYEPKTSAMFHNTRSSRIAGKSEDGGIFYYESLDAGQEFKTVVSGTEAVLQELKAALGNDFNASIGRSRSVQYGDAEFSLGEIRPINSEVGEGEDEENLFVLTCLSPLVLLNSFGLAEPTAKTLQQNLLTSGIEAEIQNAVAAFGTHEHYVGVWKSKTEQITTFKEGTSFLLKIKDSNEIISKLNALQQSGLGEYKSLGYGKITIEPFQEKESIFVRPYSMSEENYSASEPKTELLKEIIDHYNKIRGANEIKKKAIEAVNISQKKLNNHLISRMIQLLDKAEELDKAEDKKNVFIGWINSLNGKPAGDSLTKAGLTKKLEKDAKEWPSFRLYWKTYFKTLRKINKKNERNGTKAK